MESDRVYVLVREVSWRCVWSVPSQQLLTVQSLRSFQVIVDALVVYCLQKSHIIMLEDALKLLRIWEDWVFLMNRSMPNQTADMTYHRFHRETMVLPDYVGHERDLNLLVIYIGSLATSVSQRSVHRKQSLHQCFLPLFLQSTSSQSSFLEIAMRSYMHCTEQESWLQACAWVGVIRFLCSHVYTHQDQCTKLDSMLVALQPPIRSEWFDELVGILRIDMRLRCGCLGK